MTFKTITKNEIENGFINAELRDYEDKVIAGDLNPDEQKKINDDLNYLAEMLRD